MNTHREEDAPERPADQPEAGHDDDRAIPDVEEIPDAPARGPGAPATGERPLGINLLTWLYWFWGGATVLIFLSFVVGEGPVPMSGETLSRSAAFERVLPVLLPMGLAVIGAALALTFRWSWARPAVLLPLVLAAFGPALTGVGALTDVIFGALALVPILAALVWYLYFRTRTVAYFERLKEAEGEAE